jgi:tetratricopeptide (TPR) repeat protein
MSRGASKIVLGLIIAACACAAACGGAKGDDETTAAAAAGGGGDNVDAKYQAYMDQAGLAVTEERTQDALDAYLAAAAVLDGTGQVTIERAEAHFLAADLAYQRVDRDLAIDEYQKSIDIYLRFTGNSKIKAAVALTNMGVMYKEKADKNKARNCWEDALQLYKEAPPELQDRRNMEKIAQNIRDLDAGF